MKYIIRLTQPEGCEYCGYETKEAHGDTPEAAMENLYRQTFRPRLYMELAPGVEVPEGETGRIPATMPDGLTLVVFARSHSDYSYGDAGRRQGANEVYEWRFFGLKPETRLRFQQVMTIVGTEPTMVNTPDGDDEVTYLLPERSMEFVTGRWVVCSRLDYLPNVTPRPTGLAVVRLKIWSHCHGGTLRSFVLAVKPGTLIHNHVIGTGSNHIEMNDHEFDSYITLPKGSVKYDKGSDKWVPREILQYNDDK